MSKVQPRNQCMIKPEFEPKIFTFKYNTLKTMSQLTLILRIWAQCGSQYAVVFMALKEIWGHDWFFQCHSSSLYHFSTSLVFYLFIPGPIVIISQINNKIKNYVRPDLILSFSDQSPFKEKQYREATLIFETSNPLSCHNVSKMPQKCPPVVLLKYGIRLSGLEND